MAGAPKRLRFSRSGCPKITHYCLRYPAKFHPPVVRKLIETYTHTGAVVLDPVCGSGTLAIEALLLNRCAVGIDVDPIAVFASRVKTRRVKTQALEHNWENLLLRLNDHRRSRPEYVRRQQNDIKSATVESILRREDLWAPNIPNLQHWFRNYVIVDLARILSEIEILDAPANQIDFFLLCFASIIRNV